jgi:hypothetical protein
MVDHHSLPEPVVSTRLKDVLEPLNLYGVQIVPADVRMRDDTTLRYWLLHLWHEIPCMDRKRSVFKPSSDGVFLLSLDRLVLDEQVLKDIPLEKRLVFLLEEDTVHLFHGSVVERIMALQPPPEGLRFVPVEQWGDASAFR